MKHASLNLRKALADNDHFEFHREGLRRDLKQFSYEERDVTLSSGAKSDYYIDCKQTVLRGRGHLAVGRTLVVVLQAMDSKAAAVGGLTLGADPLVSAVSFHATQSWREIHGILVRKEPKKHGTESYIEGVSTLKVGAEVVVLEDVVTTGAASLTAAARLRAIGFNVTQVLALVDREAGGRENLREQGLSLFSLFTAADFR